MSRIVRFHFRDYDAKNATKDKIYYDCGGSSAYEDYGSEQFEIMTSSEELKFKYTI